MKRTAGSAQLPASSDGAVSVHDVERNPCTRDAEDAGFASGATARIPGLLTIDAPDGTSPTHGARGASQAPYRLGNHTERTLEVRVSALQLRDFTDAGDRETFGIAAAEVAGIAQASPTTLSIPPRSCVDLQLTADRVPTIRYDERFAFVATFSVEGQTVQARSGDRYFRRPLPPRP